MEIAEGLAESAVATGTRQDVDVQVEDDRPIAGIAHRQGETLVVHQRQRVGYRSPSKQTRRSHLTSIQFNSIQFNSSTIIIDNYQSNI